MEARFETTSFDVLLQARRLFVRSAPILVAVLLLLSLFFETRTKGIEWKWILDWDFWVEDGVDLILWPIVASTLRLVALVFVVILAGVYWRFRKLTPERRRGVVTAGPQGFQIVDDANANTVIAWNSVKQVVAKPRHLLVFLKTGGMVQIPTRAFSTSQVEAFCALAQGSRMPDANPSSDLSPPVTSGTVRSEPGDAGAEIRTAYALRWDELAFASLMRWGRRGVVVTTIPLLLILCALLLSQFGSNSSDPTSAETFGLVALVLCGLLFRPASAVWQYWRLGPAWMRVTFVADANGFTIFDGAGNHSRHQWSVIGRLTETAGLFYAVVNGFVIPIPKRAFSQEQLASLRAFVRDAGVRAKLRNSPA